MTTAWLIRDHTEILDAIMAFLYRHQGLSLCADCLAEELSLPSADVTDAIRTLRHGPEITDVYEWCARCLTNKTAIRASTG